MRFEQQISAYLRSCGDRRADPVPVRFRPPGVRFRTEPGGAPDPDASPGGGDRSPGSAAPDHRRRGGEDGAREQPRHPGAAPQPADPGAPAEPDARDVRAAAVLEHDEEQQQQSAEQFPGRATTSPPARVSGTTRVSSSSLKWGGGRYSASIDGARSTTSDRTDAFNPRLSSNFNFNFTQPLLRDFSIDSTRQQLLIGQKQQEIVDVQLQQQVTQTARAVRSAYLDLVGAIGQLEVARKSLDLANESLKNNQRRVEVGTIPPIDIVEAQAEVSRNEEAVIINEAQIKSLEDVLRTLIMNPSQPDLLDRAHRAGRTAGADAAGGRRRGARSGTRSTSAPTSRRRANSSSRPTSASSSRGTSGCRRINAIVNYGLAGVGGTQHHLRGRGRRVSQAGRRGAAQFRGRVAGRLRQRVQDLERPVAGELSHRHERSRGGARPGPRAAPAGRHEPARARAAGHGRGARRGAAGGHDPEARRSHAQGARVRREAVRGRAEADDRRPVDDVPGVPGAARSRRSSSSPSSTRSSPTTARW